MIPFISFSYKKDQISREIIDSINSIIKSEKYVLGENTIEFEKNYSNLINSAYCVGVGSGLDALIISLKSLNIRPEDEIIVPSNTYIASWLAVSSIGAKIVPVEPDIETYNINPKLIENKITKKTKAIMPVHLYGQPCDMTKIMDIAKKNNLYVVEDNAQGHMSKWKNKFTGSFGDINATSFYPTKNIGAIGEAGAITTNNSNLADYAKQYRNYGSKIKYENNIIGTNSRIDEIQAAIINVKLKYIVEMNNERIKNAKIYNNFLKNTDIIIPHNHSDSYHTYHLYVVRHQHRDSLQKYLYNKGVQTSIHYPIIPQNQKAYASYSFDSNPIAEELANTSLSLPIFPGIGQDKIEYISNLLIEFCKK